MPLCKKKSSNWLILKTIIIFLIKWNFVNKIGHLISKIDPKYLYLFNCKNRHIVELQREEEWKNLKCCEFPYTNFKLILIKLGTIIYNKFKKLNFLLNESLKICWEVKALWYYLMILIIWYYDISDCIVKNIKNKLEFKWYFLIIKKIIVYSLHKIGQLKIYFSLIIWRE